jgi:uncharacterized membrane protein
MVVASKRILKVLAAIVWIVGGVVLTLKGASLLAEANDLQAGRHWPQLAVAAGLLIGGLKAKYLFNKRCRKNLARIDALDRPRVWEFFRPWFFLFLTLMILTGATLSRMAHGNYPALIAVAILDFSIATALLVSSRVFWKQSVIVR